MSLTAKVVYREGMRLFVWTHTSTLSAFPQINYYDSLDILHSLSAADMEVGTVVTLTTSSCYTGFVCTIMPAPSIFPDIDYGDDT